MPADRRYGPLHHPGDRYADDIFSQAAQAIRHPSGIAPLGGLTAEHLIAIGESQSAIALDNYILSGADQAAQVIDGFMIDADGHAGEPAGYRVPTLHVWSEESARPDLTITANHVAWSVAGAAHTDRRLLTSVPSWAGHLVGVIAPSTESDRRATQYAGDNYGQEGPGDSLTCAGDDEFPRRYAVDAAITDVEEWVDNGIAAPAAPPLRFVGGDRTPQPIPPSVAGVLSAFLGAADPELGTFDVNAILGAPAALSRDENGNAIGGLRLPPISVPVAAYDGAACILAGTTTPLPPARLHQLYPTHADYVARMIDAVRDSIGG